MLKLPVSKGTSKRRAFIITGVICLLAVAGVAAYWLTQNRPVANTSSSPEVVEPAPDKTKVPDNPGPSSSDQVPQKENASVTITRVEQTGNDVIIEGTLTGATEGNCVAEFTTPQDNPVIGEAKATKVGDGAKCGPITLPAADFAYLGEWQAVLKVYVNDGQVVSPTKTITIK